MLRGPQHILGGRSGVAQYLRITQARIVASIIIGAIRWAIGWPASASLAVRRDDKYYPGRIEP